MTFNHGNLAFLLDVQVDPLKKDLLMTQAEKSLLLTCRGACSSADSRLSSTKVDRAVLRPTLDVRRWAAGQIHATPYGHCIDDATANYVIRASCYEWGPALHDSRCFVALLLMVCLCLLALVASGGDDQTENGADLLPCMVGN
jgi:hypothetical protein